jgi:hypothetical protein
LAEEEAGRAFDLHAGEVLRAQVLRVGEREHVLLLNLHHIAFDGWSIGILVRELTALYEAYTSGEPAALPELPIQYADFAVWQRQYLQGEVLQGQLAYWKERLAGLHPCLKLRTDSPRPKVQTYRGAFIPFTLPDSLVESLRTFCRQQGGTLFMTLLTVFEVLLHHHTGESDFVVGSPMTSRNRAETEGLIGFFLNTLALRADLSGEPSFRQLFERTREVVLGAYANQDVPFERLIEELHLERDPSYSPLVQVAFTLQNIQKERLKLTGLSLSPFELKTDTTQFDLTLNIADETDKVYGTFWYNTDLFEPSTVTKLVRHFETLLGRVVTRPDAALKDLRAALDEADAQRQQAFRQMSHKRLGQLKPQPVRVSH